MALPGALHLALDLARSPLLATAMRGQPLPHDVLILIQLAGADAGTLSAVSKRTNRNGNALRAAAVLYIQQVLWGPDSDHYRALGVDRNDPPEKLKEHLRWLMKWLHPDKPQSAAEAVFRDRVVTAWNALKTPERRMAYDRTLPVPTSVKRRRRRSRLPWIAEATDGISEWRGFIWWRLAGAMVVAAAVAAWWSTGDWRLPAFAVQNTDISTAASGGYTGGDLGR